MNNLAMLKLPLPVLRSSCLGCRRLCLRAFQDEACEERTRASVPGDTLPHVEHEAVAGGGNVERDKEIRRLVAQEMAFFLARNEEVPTSIMKLACILYGQSVGTGSTEDVSGVTMIPKVFRQFDGRF